MNDCNNYLQSKNLPYPRTCQECGLGPCHHSFAIYSYQDWKNCVLEWAERHQISFDSAISILSNDSPFNPSGKDFVTVKDLYWAYFNDYIAMYRGENMANKTN